MQTVAGSVTPGNADGPGSLARFRAIAALSADHAGNVYITDYGNNAVRLMKRDYSVTTLIAGKVPANTTLGNAPLVRAPLGIALLPNGAIAISSEAAILLD